ncbi:MAG: glycosyltransferase [Candidatus Vecturithrix sp.]|nr:glycosyltransferase [Candidatus Vecturithrix sp.]
MDISCVLLTWNSERYITSCLGSLITALKEGNLTYQIFIVDNGSRDKTVSILQTFQARNPEQIYPIYLQTNTGTTYSRNLALKQAIGRYVCIMDSDVEVTTGVFAYLTRTLESHSKIGLVAPKLLYPSGSLQKSTDVFPTITRKILRYFFLKALERREHKFAVHANSTTQRVQEVDYAISAMWLLKHEVVERIGLLDEKIFYAPEDVDYCLRIWKAGYTVVYDTSVSCVHHTQEISRGFRLNRAMLDHTLGLVYYFRKHRYVFRKPKVR